MLLAEVDITPLYGVLNQFLSVLLEGVVVFASGWIMYLLHKYGAPVLDAQIEAKARDALNTALKNGVAIAMQKVQNAENAHKDVAVKGTIASMAAQYAIDHVPGAIGRFGLDPADLANKALAYLPTPKSDDGTAGATVVVAPVTSTPLAPLT